MPIIKHSGKRDRDRRADQKRGTARERGYTTSWDKFARSFLIAHPLCLYCANQGRTAAAELVDHIVPHSGDGDAFWPPFGTEWQEFFAPCCKDCHNGPKQRAEKIANNTGRDVREYLVKWGMLPAGFPGSDPEAPIPNAWANLICGPPAAGKTTYAREQLQACSHDRVKIYDLDDIAEDMGFPKYGRTLDQERAALTRRDLLLREHDPDFGLILIASCPTLPERLHWSKRLGCDATMLVEPREVLVNRIGLRTPIAAGLEAIGSQIEAVDAWFARADV